MGILSMGHSNIGRPTTACSISDAPELEERLCRSEHPGIANMKIELFNWSRVYANYFS